MNTKRSIRPVWIGALAGFVVFSALKCLEAFGQSIAVAEVAADPAKYYGRRFALSGLPSSIRQSQKYMGRGKPSLSVVSFLLYEPSGDQKYPRGKRYVSVSLPVDAFQYLPAENQPLSVTGTFQPPKHIGSIEPE